MWTCFWEDLALEDLFLPGYDFCKEIARSEQAKSCLSRAFL